MQCVARLFESAALRLGLDLPSGVVLRRQSGQLLTDGSVAGEPVRFGSVAEATRFCRRFLDEPAAWQPVPAVRRAA